MQKEEADAGWQQRQAEWHAREQALEMQKEEADAGWQQRQAEWHVREQALEMQVVDTERLLQQAMERISGLIDASEAAQARALETERELQRRAADYLRSRRKWKIAMFGLGVCGFIAGVLLGWGVL